MRANQMRLYFSSFAYVLMHALRRLGAEGTQFARAQSPNQGFRDSQDSSRSPLTS